jgi:oligopeptide/dipeptide ABC transporter ATP-binding protein
VTVPVREVSFEVREGERVGVVGESGSGKTLTALAIAQLVEEPGRVEAERVEFLGVNLLDGGAKVSTVLGKSLGLVFQDPGGTLNPSVRIGTHLREPAEIHLGLSKKVAAERALASLRSVSIPDPKRRYKQHQHELSGGMKQRVSIAMGLMADPRLVIADEPTTALDVSVQRQVLRVLMRAGGEKGASLLLISHDMAVVSAVCDRVVVMYAGFVVEDAPTDALVRSPAHPYTGVLMAASPNMSMEVGHDLPIVDGRVPTPEEALPGCFFAPRCARASDRCTSERPPLEEVEGGRKVACWHPLAGEAHERSDVSAVAAGTVE